MLHGTSRLRQRAGSASHHEGCGGHAAVLCKELSVEAGEAEVQQVGLLLEGGRKGPDQAIFVGWQHAPREIDCMAVAVHDALHSCALLHMLVFQRCAGSTANRILTFGFNGLRCDCNCVNPPATLTSDLLTSIESKRAARMEMACL